MGPMMTTRASVMSVDDIHLLTPEWDAPPNVRAFNTTRLGGVSKAPYDGLNLGLHVNDNPVAVKENRARMRDAMALPMEPKWLNQVHGCDVLSLSESPFKETSDASPMQAEPVEADAAFTDQKDTVLCVLTADCLPVLITNQEGTELAVAHAGWKGLLNGVIEASLDKFSATSHFHVWLGPAIGSEKFEVGPEVKEAFVSKNAAHASAFTASRAGDEKQFANIYTLARQTINRALSSATATATATVSGGDRCTFSESKYFHSYRRDGAASGRMALVAWLTS